MERIPDMQTGLMDIAEFEVWCDLAENRERRVELIHGEIKEKMPTEEHGALVVRLIMLVGSYVDQQALGRLTTEVRHRIPTDEHNSRLPDIAFTRRDNLTPIVTRGPVPRMPDMVIEIKSPDDSYTELRDKAKYYLANGTQLVWLVYPEKRLVEVYRPHADSELLTAEDVLEGRDILPNFTLPIETIFNIT